MEGMERDGKDRGKVFKMVTGSGFKDARLYSKGGITEGKAENKGRNESLEFWEEAGKGKGERVGEVLLKGDERESKRREDGIELGERERREWLRIGDGGLRRWKEGEKKRG